MSGPFFIDGSLVGEVNSSLLGAYPELNGVSAQLRLNFELIEDEAVFPVLIGGKLTGKTVSCPGQNVAWVRACPR